MGQLGRGEIVDMEALAPSVGGFSDDGRGVQSDETMAEAMRRAKAVGRPIVAHCEVNELLRGGYIHDGEYAQRNGHRGICSESEWAQVARDIELVERLECSITSATSTKEVWRLSAAKVGGEGELRDSTPLLGICDEDLQEEGASR